ncbi:hypothetical protein CGLAMM_05180 [Acetobacteraceae bacterium EV16G]|uniref:Alkylmercury lyase n=1 Tax=Sorlinia euscelidii TaxID=3081148 RepID=A0ABU7TZJ6_9PROT
MRNRSTPRRIFSQSGEGLITNIAHLHESIIKTFILQQRPPTRRELSTHLRCDDVQVRTGLHALADDHGVVLHPGSDEIWIAHPFSAAPTTCVVTLGDRKWWGNCIWCALGVVHLIGGTGTIETRLSAIDAPVTVRIENGVLLDEDFVVHFPIKMKQAWENVVYTCSVQLLFRDAAQTDEWCAVRNIPRGDVRPIRQIWEFAKIWYGRHADADWKKWTVKEAIEIFARHHLDGPTWSLSEEAARF